MLGGGVPPAVCVSELLRVAAEVDPLIVVEMAPSTDLRGPATSGLDASRNYHDSGGQVEIVTVPELEIFPDVAELGDLPQVAPLVRNSGGPATTDGELDSRIVSEEIPYEARLEGQRLPHGHGEQLSSRSSSRPLRGF